MRGFVDKISIVIPIYNSERYLEACIQSVLDSSYKNIEVVLINDGSTDLSGEICEKYRDKDERVIYYKTSNNGVTLARKLGVECASSQYVCFVDSDDLLQPNYLSTLIKSFKSDSHIVVEGPYNRDVDSVTFLKEMLTNKQDWTVLRKIYKRDLLLGSKAFTVPKEINVGEDLIGNIYILREVENVQIVKGNSYILRENPYSVTKTRLFSAEYEAAFIKQVKDALGPSIEQYQDELWLLELRTIKNLLLNDVIVKRNHPIYTDIISCPRPNIECGIGDVIPLHIRSPYVAMWLLKMLKKFKKNSI